MCAVRELSKVAGVDWGTLDQAGRTVLEVAQQGWVRVTSTNCCSTLDHTGLIKFLEERQK